jgi:hypothetical protein
MLNRKIVNLFSITNTYNKSNKLLKKDFSPVTTVLDHYIKEQ